MTGDDLARRVATCREGLLQLHLYLLLLLLLGLREFLVVGAPRHRVPVRVLLSLLLMLLLHLLLVVRVGCRVGLVLLLRCDPADNVMVLGLWLLLIAGSAVLIAVVFEGFELHVKFVIALLEDAVGLFEGS